MGLERSFGRGRGLLPGLVDGNQPGGSNSNRELPITDEQNLNRELPITGGSDSNGELPLTDENDRANGNDPIREVTQNVSGVSGRPNGNSSIQREDRGQPPLLDAIRTMLADGANEGTRDVVAQLLNMAIGSQRAAPPVQQTIPTYHVIPDLSKRIEDFGGDEDSVSANEWISVLESLQRLHQLPEEHLLDAAKMHLKRGARDWANAESDQLRTWNNFRTLFRATFMVRDDTSTRWDKMKARRQEKNELVTQYFHAKRKLCRRVNLTFHEEKTEIILGLQSRELSNLVLTSQHHDAMEFLHDLVRFDKIITQRTEVARATREASHPSRGNANRTTNYSRAATVTSESSKENAEGQTVSSGNVRRDRENRDSKTGVVKCYNCGRIGHLSRACREAKKEFKCYKCDQTGHISRNCPSNTGQSGSGTVQAIGAPHDPAATKFLKTILLNGREMNAFVDSGSSECTIVATRVLLEGFRMNPSPIPLKGFGPPECMVTSPGTVCASVCVDGIELNDVKIRVVPDNVQPIEVIIGRSFTEHPTIEYHRVGDSLTFSRAKQLPDIESAAVINHATSSVVSIPPRTVGFVSVYHDMGELIVPVANEGLKECTVRKDKTIIRGEVSRVLLSNTVPNNKKIERSEIEVGDDQPGEVVLELCDLINEFRDCVSTNLHDLGCAKDIEMDIRLNEGAQPVVSKPYRTTDSERRDIRTIVSEWKKSGIATETQSPYASPVLLVKKKTGEPRLCVDFRKLNNVTERVHFPLPNIDDHLALIRDSSLFVVLDLAHGYLQIPLAPNAREKTAIITPDETVEFTRMVFGLMNGPAYFSRAMHRALGPLRDEVVLYYLDDILIPGKTWTDLRPKLRMVFEALRKAGLTIKLSKCKFLCRRVAYLGHVLSEKGIEPGEVKVLAIREFARPCNVHEVRRFLGLTSFFRKFVPHFASIASPLSRLLRNDITFNWGDEQEYAFTELKRKLTEGPVLQTFDPTKETEMHTDASASGLAAMLMQRNSTVRGWQLVYAISRRTSEPESRYHSSKLELLAIVWGVTRLRPMLANIQFTVVTDCQALCYLSTQKTINPQIVRWNDQLSEYNYKIVHRPGERLAHVDALSRAPVDEANVSVLSITSEDDVVRMYQFSDVELKEKKRILSKKKNERTKDEKGRVENLELRDGILYKRWEDRLLYCVPNAMRKSLVVKFHDLKSHAGVERTVARILEHYHFPRIRAYVRRHIVSCLQCVMNKSKPGRQPGELHSIPPGHRPFATVHADHLGPFVSSARGNKYVLVLIDNLTKFAILRAVRDTRTSRVIQVMEEFVREYGAPARIITDRGTCFTAKLFEECCDRHGIRHILNSPRHPQANGQVERLNAVIVPAIQANLVEADGRDWDKAIRKIQADINDAKTTSTGHSPFELLFGYVPSRHEGLVRTLTNVNGEPYRLPKELQEEARTTIIEKQRKSKSRYDAGRARNVILNVGDIVYVRAAIVSTGESTKLQPKYRGPMVVLRKVGGDTYHIAELNETNSGRRFASTAHISQLKLWKPNEDDNEQVIENEDDNEQVIENEDDNEQVIENEDDNEQVIENEDDNEQVIENKDDNEQVIENEDNNEQVIENEDETNEVDEVEVRRKSKRVRRPPNRLKDYELE